MEAPQFLQQRIPTRWYPVMASNVCSCGSWPCERDNFPKCRHSTESYTGPSIISQAKWGGLNPDAEASKAGKPIWDYPSFITENPSLILIFYNRARDESEFFEKDNSLFDDRVIPLYSIQLWPMVIPNYRKTLVRSYFPSIDIIC